MRACVRACARACVWKVRDLKQGSTHTPELLGVAELFDELVVVRAPEHALAVVQVLSDLGLETVVEVKVDHHAVDLVEVPLEPGVDG